jgi:hypothetical protein
VTPADTSATAAAIQIAVLRRLTGTERLSIAVDMSLATRALALARLRREHPRASEAELRKELLRLAFAPAEDLPPALR